MRVLSVQLNPTVADLKGNFAKIKKGLDEGRHQGVDLVLFPELCLCGYPPEDFLLLDHFVDSVESLLNDVVEASQGLNVIIGTIRRNPGKQKKGLFNTAAVIGNGQLLGFQDKTLLPTYDVFDELRYFEPAQESHVWELSGKRVGVTICEDIWHHGGEVSFATYREDPVVAFQEKRLDLLVNLSSSPYHVGKPNKRTQICQAAATTLKCPVVLCNQVGGNDSLIFDGHSLHVGADGELLAQGAGFQEEMLVMNIAEPAPCVIQHLTEPDEMLGALILGVRDYFSKQGFRKACLGLSGGIDSAIVAYIAVEALGKENVLAVLMPSRYSTDSSLIDAEQLIQNLGIPQKVIPIESPFQCYLDLLDPHFEGMPQDATEENLQARIRGMLLMALSNKCGHIVLSTGNKSELAMGYSTLYGDMCGGLSVISDVSKEQVYAVARWLNRHDEVIPQNIIDKAPSAELRPDQKDSDSLPEYVIVDAVLEGYIEEHLAPEAIAKQHKIPLEIVEGLVKKIHRSEYKRRQGSPCLRVTERAFSVGRRFPIVQGWV